MAEQRLPWRRRPGGDFIAHPEGEHPGRMAEIRYDTTSSTKWTWFITYDLARASGVNTTPQEAADAATDAWGRVKAEAAALSIKASAEEALRSLVYRQCDKGDLPLIAFEIETSSSEQLRHILWLITDRKALGGLAQPLVSACSRELFHRRIGTASTDGE